MEALGSILEHVKDKEHTAEGRDLTEEKREEQEKAEQEEQQSFRQESASLWVQSLDPLLTVCAQVVASVHAMVPSVTRNIVASMLEYCHGSESTQRICVFEKWIHALHAHACGVTRKEVVHCLTHVQLHWGVKGTAGEDGMAYDGGMGEKDRAKGRKGHVKVVDCLKRMVVLMEGGELEK